jgi:hypothetical protein
VNDEPGSGRPATEEGQPDTPWQQKVLDNLWLLLALSVAIPTVLYLVWGLWEIIELPTWGGAS